MGTLPGACTQIHYVNYCVHAVMNIAMSNHFKYYHVQFTQCFVYALRASCCYIENIFMTKYKIQKVLVFHSVLLGCSQSCSKRADTILYYYFHIKEEHFKCFKTKLYQNIYTKTHQIVPLFNKNFERTCPLNIQYTERSNYLPRLQCHSVYISNGKF